MTVNLLFRIKSVKTFRCPFFGGAVEPGVSRGHREGGHLGLVKNFKTPFF